jgi:hypothetical protein
MEWANTPSPAYGETPSIYYGIHRALQDLLYFLFLFLYRGRKAPSFVCARAGVWNDKFPYRRFLFPCGRRDAVSFGLPDRTAKICGSVWQDGLGNLPKAKPLRKPAGPSDGRAYGESSCFLTVSPVLRTGCANGGRSFRLPGVSNLRPTRSADCFTVC